MKERIQKFVNRFGWSGFLRLLFVPVTTLFTTPIRLVQSLWNCKVLVRGQWGDYNRFSAHKGINYLHYWTQSVNIQRYGRNGISRELGLGDFSLSKLFHMTSLSLRLYHKLGGSMAVIIGMFGWLVAYLLWFDLSAVVISYGITVFFLALISTTFYANLFEHQNYNVLGWMFLPVGLFGILTGNYFLASIALLGASFGSFTVFYLSVWVILAVALLKLDWLVLLTLCPGLVKIITGFFPLIAKGNLRKIIANRARDLGIRGKAKYKRNLRLGIKGFYFLGLWGIFCGAVYLWSYPVFDFAPWQLTSLVGLAPLFWVVNKRISRFADPQSLYMFFLSLATAVMMLQKNIALLPFYWIAISPVPRFLRFSSEPDVLDIVPKREPFFVRSLIDSAEKFLHQVPSNSRVLFAFEDPKRKHGNIFDGYRVLLELPLYVAACRKIHLFPDWRAVFETNYEGAPNFWGREIGQVITNTTKWDVDFAIVYQESGTELDPKWEENNFLKLGVFSWKELQGELKGQCPFRGPWVDWWLLKVQKHKNCDGIGD